MNSRTRQDRQLRAVRTAIFAGIVVAVSAMFVPVAILEVVMRVTGVSGVFQATAAPMGDAARAVIAFSSGAVTLALMSVLLMRGIAGAVDADMYDWTAAGIPETDDDLTPTWKERFASLGLPTLKRPQMPWIKSDDDIIEFADLPKLRNGDVHPDAPARQPLLASQDLPVLDLPETAGYELLAMRQKVELDFNPAFGVTTAIIPTVTDDIVANIAQPDLPVEPVAIAEEPSDSQPSLAEMVAQLEASVSQRQQQLADLELVAANLAAKKTDFAQVTFEEPAEPVPLPEPEVERVRQIRPVLEAVPASQPHDEDMDAALAAALATLHRMNGTGG